MKKNYLKEIEIQDPAIVAQLEKFYHLQNEIDELSDRMKVMEKKYGEFAKDLAPMFETMKQLEEKTAVSEYYIITIKQPAYESQVHKYKKAYEYALTKLNEATKAVCKKLEEEESTVRKVSTRFTIGKLSEASTADKVKLYLNKIVSFFSTKIKKYLYKIDDANKELKALASIKESKTIKLSDFLKEDWKNLQPFGEQEWNRVNNIAKRSKQDDYLDGIMNSIKKQGYKATERQKNYVKMWLQSGKEGIQWGRKN